MNSKLSKQANLEYWDSIIKPVMNYERKSKL